MQRQHPQSVVTLWSYDEHRLGLLPIRRKSWSKRGVKIVMPVEQRYQWLYLYGFVAPQTGETYWLLMPTVSLALFQVALEEFAKGQGISKDKQAIIVIDGAGFHNPNSITVPPGIHLVFLPPYSPEIQPAERLWQLSDEGVANRHFTSLDDLEEAQVKRCQTLRTMQAAVKGRCNFHWWPTI